jgi:hypothetical protein
LEVVVTIVVSPRQRTCGLTTDDQGQYKWRATPGAEPEGAFFSVGSLDFTPRRPSTEGSFGRSSGFPVVRDQVRCADSGQTCAGSAHDGKMPVD